MSKPLVTAKAIYRCSLCGQPKAGHKCPSKVGERKRKEACIRIDDDDTGDSDHLFIVSSEDELMTRREWRMPGKMRASKVCRSYAMQLASNRDAKKQRTGDDKSSGSGLGGTATSRGTTALPLPSTHTPSWYDLSATSKAPAAATRLALSSTASTRNVTQTETTTFASPQPPLLTSPIFVSTSSELSSSWKGSVSDAATPVVSEARFEFEAGYTFDHASESYIVTNEWKYMDDDVQKVLNSSYKEYASNKAGRMVVEFQGMPSHTNPTGKYLVDWSMNMQFNMGNGYPRRIRCKDLYMNELDAGLCDKHAYVHLSDTLNSSSSPLTAPSALAQQATPSALARTATHDVLLERTGTLSALARKAAPSKTNDATLPSSRESDFDPYTRTFASRSSAKKLFPLFESKHRQLALQIDVSYPAYWPTSSIRVSKTIRLSRNSPLFCEVAGMVVDDVVKGPCCWDKTMKPLFIHSVELVCNAAKWNMYAAKKQELQSRLGCANVNEKWMWHGLKHFFTDPSDKKKYDLVRVITEGNGYDRDYSTVQVWGKGTYFARSLSYSIDERYATTEEIASNTHEKVVLLNRVLVGDPCIGASGMQRPVRKSETEIYDSMVNNIDDPTIVVLSSGSDSQAYPEFVVRFRKSKTE